MDNKNKKVSNKQQIAHLGISDVMWRKYIIPTIIALVVATTTRVGFGLLPDNILFNDFLSGWISCTAYYVARSYSAT